MRFLANVDPRFVVSFHQPLDETTVELPRPRPQEDLHGRGPRGTLRSLGARRPVA
jgi:hypothetical protein